MQNRPLGARRGLCLLDNTQRQWVHDLVHIPNHGLSYSFLWRGWSIALLTFSWFHHSEIQPIFRYWFRIRFNDHNLPTHSNKILLLTSVNCIAIRFDSFWIHVAFVDWWDIRKAFDIITHFLFTWTYISFGTSLCAGCYPKSSCTWGSHVARPVHICNWCVSSNLLLWMGLLTFRSHIVFGGFALLCL